MLLTVLPFGAVATETPATTENIVPISQYSTTTTYPDGTVFTISSPEELQTFNTTKNPFNVFVKHTVRLIQDIDYSGYTWNGIIFNGHFDGDGYTISNLTVSNCTNGAGMFRYAGGTIENLTLRNIKVEFEITQVGAVVGSRNNSNVNGVGLTINNVHVINGTVSGTECVGGILGSTNTGSASAPAVSITNCSFNGTVSAKNDTLTAATAQNVGGIVGYGVNASQLSISNCRVVADVTGNSSYGQDVGGIVGQTKVKTTVSGCYVGGTISTGSTGSGGIIGLSKASEATIQSCYVNATLTGWGGRRGGIIGNIVCDESTTTIKDCFVGGLITTWAENNYNTTGAIVGCIGANTDGKTNVVNCSNILVAVSDNSKFSSVLGFYQGTTGSSSGKLENVYYVNSLGETALSAGSTDSNSVAHAFTPSTDSTYGAKTADEIKAYTGEGWTSVKDNYPLPTGLANGTTYLAGYQTGNSTDTTVDYRFVGVMNLPDDKEITDYSDVGFYVTLTENTENTVLQSYVKVSCNTVYQTVSGGGIEYKVSEYGGDYLFALVLEGVPTGSKFTVELIPYTVDCNGITSIGISGSLTVSQ